MTKWTEEDIEKFIRENRDRFQLAQIDPGHKNRFIQKLRKRFFHIVSIVPYLVKVLIVWIIATIISICVWNSFLRKDRHEITLKQKIENITNIKK